MDDMQTLKFRLAENKDIAPLLKMINAAYRQQHDQSWTSEAGIISGDRINQAQLEALLQRQHSPSHDAQLLIAELNTQSHEEIVGCIALNYSKFDAEIGTYCIAPAWQASGFGQQVLQAAELYAIKHEPKLKTFTMWVLDVREELIAYYERRGYVVTSVVEDYPADADVGEPLVELKMIQMQKQVGT